MVVGLFVSEVENKRLSWVSIAGHLTAPPLDPCLVNVAFGGYTRPMSNQDCTAHYGLSVFPT